MARKIPNRRLPEINGPLPLNEYTSRYWRIPHDQQMKEPGQIATALRERIKELNCLYGIAQLAERYAETIEELLGHLVDFLPLSWQYPNIACVRILFDGRTYQSPHFRVTPWRQESRILVYNEPRGEVGVFYLEERPAADEGPFLKEERIMLDEVARRIGAVAVRIAAEQELQEINRQLSLERSALQESNAALRAVLARIGEEKQQIVRDLQAQIEKIILPILQVLFVEMPKEKRNYVEILRTNLEEIAAPFLQKLGPDHHSLTQTEINICNLIRNGLRTKEIAKLRGVSVATVHRHREHIRKKLKLNKAKVNLATHLHSLG
jgi:DNA-binding CsgD family transcriptional regulator